MVEMLRRGISETDAEGEAGIIHLSRLHDASEAGSAPTLLLMAGFAGAGKTTLARRLHQEFGWVVINKDELKLAHLASGDWQAMDAQAQRTFIEAAGQAAFNELLERTYQALQQRKSVIVDTSNEKPAIFSDLQRLLTRLGEGDCPLQPRLLIVLCMATKEERSARLKKRGSVFEPYVHELPTILDDTALPERFQHLFQAESSFAFTSTDRNKSLAKWRSVFAPSVDLPAPACDNPPSIQGLQTLFAEENVFFVNTNLELQTYADEVLNLIKLAMQADPFC